MSEPEDSRGEGGAYVEAIRPCMKVMQKTNLDSAAIVLGLTTNQAGYLKHACIKTISFDEPPLLECVMHAMLTSSVRIAPNLERKFYTLNLFLID